MKRILSAVLAVVMLIGILPAGVSASSYKTMTVSQNMLDIIKDSEGFAPYPYWDYSQYSIGYGTSCGSTESEVPPEYWNGISEEKGEELLRQHMDRYVTGEVNDFFREIGRQPNQAQFDAMVDFTYALGSGWIYGSRVRDYLENPTGELELMRVLGAWCRAGGSVFEPACSRRIREALIYLYGAYYLNNGSIQSDLQVIPDDDLPMFNYVVYNGNGVGISPSGYEDTVEYYYSGMKYGTLLKPTDENAFFSGWYRSDGSILLDTDRVTGNEEVFARWTKLPYADVSDQRWYSTAVAYCYEKNIMHGSNSATFSPDQKATRGMIVTVLYRMAGEPSVSGNSDFQDVKSDKYYSDAVKWAVENGIVLGYKDGTFRPDNKVTRSELVTFLYRYADNVAGADVSSQAEVSSFGDADQIPDYADTAFRWALHSGLIKGINAQTLAPNSDASRAQMAQMLMTLDNIG